MPFVASKLRTAELPTSSLTLNASLRFPTKDASEVLDYSLDCTRWLRDGADTVASFTVALSPAGAGDLQLDSKNPPGPVLTAFLSRGLVGAQYAVTFLGVTTGGRTFERIVLPLTSKDEARRPISFPAAAVRRETDGPPRRGRQRQR